MGESRLKEEVRKTTLPGAGEDASSRLREDVFDPVKRAGSDRAAEQGTQANAPGVDNPFDHIKIAGAAARELTALKDKAADDTVTVSETPGVSLEVKVSERRAQLKELIESELGQSINAADRIDRGRVETSLWEVRTRQSNASDIFQLEALSRQEAVLEAMKHALSVTRFAMATYLAEQGDLVRSKVYLEQIAKIDKEAALDPVYTDLTRAVEESFRGQRAGFQAAGDPFQALESAQEKRKAGDAKGAESDYKRAIEYAAKLDPEFVRQQLAQIEEAKTKNAGNAEVFKQLKDMEVAIGHTQSIASINYAEFLIEQKRSAEAREILERVEKNDPDLVKDNPEFKQLKAAASLSAKTAEPFDNPFEHINKFQELYKRGDLTQARAELEAAVKAADKVDRKLMQENKKVIDEALKEEKDPAERKRLTDLRDVYESFDHAAASTRLALGRFELAGKNYNSARALFEEVQKRDPELAARPEIKMDELMEASKEPSTWQKVWGWTKDLFKELVCDAAAIVAGVGAAVLTGWSGPAAVAVGAAAGAGTYVFMKQLMGTGERMLDGQDFLTAAKNTWKEDIHWYSPIWGALDGASGGMAAVARVGLTRVGGKIVAKELADSAVVATAKGGAAQATERLVALQGLEGMARGQAAKKLAQEGLKEMAKEVPFWSRTLARIPMVGLGNAEYRAGVALTRALSLRVMGANLLRDAGTAGTMSAVYRGGHEAYNYYTGKHEDFGSFARAYAFGVVGDATAGAALGPIGRWLGDGVSSGLAGKVTGLEKLATTFPSLGPALDTVWTASSPSVYEAYNTHNYLTNQVEPAVKYHKTPLDLRKNKREFAYRFQTTENYYNLKETGRHRLSDFLTPELDKQGRAVGIDEEFDPGAALGVERQQAKPSEGEPR